VAGAGGPRRGFTIALSGKSEKRQVGAWDLHGIARSIGRLRLSEIKDFQRDEDYSEFIDDLKTRSS